MRQWWGSPECLGPAPHPNTEPSEGREEEAGGAWPQKSAGPLPGIQGGAVTRLRVDNTVFDGCRLQFLGKDPFILGQQSDNVGAGTGLGSLRPGALFILETHKGKHTFWKHHWGC